MKLLSGTRFGLGMAVLVLALAVASALWLVDSPQDAAAQTVPPNIVVSFATLPVAQSPELLLTEGTEDVYDQYGNITTPAVDPEPILGSSGEVQYHTPEGNKMMVEVSLSAAHGDPTEVQVSATGSSASRLIDYPEETITITIPAWYTYGRGYFTITDDDKREGNETFTLNLRASVPDPGYPTASVTNHATLDTAIVTIIDDDAPIVSVQGGVTIIEGETPTWIFHSSFPVGQDMTIGFVTDISGVTTSGMVTMPAGKTKVTYRGTPPTDDSVMADPPDITLNLQQRHINQGGGYRVGEPSSATIEVHDNDDMRALDKYPPRRLTISAPFPYWTEGAPNAYRDVDRVTTFTVRAAHHLGKTDSRGRTEVRTIVFEICFTGTATQETGETWSANGDYQILKGGIVQTGTCIKDVITGHGPSANIAIRVRADNIGEEDETVIATVSTDHPGVRTAANNTKPGPYAFASYEQHTYTIIDDDSVEVWLTSDRINVLEGGTAEVEVCQSRRRSAVTVLKMNIPIGGATAGSDFIRGGDSNGTATRTVIIQPGLLCTIVDFKTIYDGLDEGEEAFTVELNTSGHSQGVTRIPRTDGVNGKFTHASVRIQDPLTITMSSNRESPFFTSRDYTSTLRIGTVYEGANITLHFDANRAAPYDIPINYSLSGNPYDAGYQTAPARGQRQVILKRGYTRASVTISVANDSIRQASNSACCMRIKLLRQPRYKPAADKQTYWVKVEGDTDENLPDGQSSQDSEQSAQSTYTPALPTTAVANVQLTAVDDASASVTWDAVAHATSYQVSWSADSNDSLTTLPSVTGTSATIQHNAQESITLTVTVTPEYVDGNGQTQVLSSLAGTATLTVTISQGSDQDENEVEPPQTEVAPPVVTPPPDCVSESLLGKVRHYYDVNKHRAPGYGLNWKRVLLAFGDLSDPNITPFTAAEAKEREPRWFGWKPVRVALDCIEEG